MDSKWIKTMEGKTIKLIEKKTGEYLCNLGGGNYFLSPPEPKTIKQKCDEFDYSKINSFCSKMSIMGKVKTREEC